ncbi:hypothetical protein Naga_100373g1 [Nannochloropsis gaditana]|uniref:Bulb-type lectin domain-containing protein n=1 Tax=Nannochloropsis gaditana TaxID=72520 RepID=W7U889_9STRA|nr:hypothetical protein Naga_100373g1 [Nannochloropsis gaditana]
MTVGSTTLTAVGNDDVFMIKLDSSGSPVWATSFGGSEYSRGVGIAVDASGSSYTTGYFDGNMTDFSVSLIKENHVCGATPCLYRGSGGSKCICFGQSAPP